MASVPEDQSHRSLSLQLKKKSSNVEKDIDAFNSSPGKNGARPLKFLDLPLDCLREVIGYLTHSNDLVALARTCSVLHFLATPSIYSRFDIVWPEPEEDEGPKTGVDALTYGLATLVMSEDVFTRSKAEPEQEVITCSNCGHQNQVSAVRTVPLDNATMPSFPRTPRRGNNYASFIKKFSIGNGPRESIRDYFPDKESGKMLQTLCAIALARMSSLETFIWDMPTGLDDYVWRSLESLAKRADGEPSRLQQVWIRLNKDDETEANRVGGLPAPPTNANAASAIAIQVPIQNPPITTFTHRTFSLLPPLKEFSVLDIDSVEHVHEMAIALDRSRDKLRVLRVGVAKHAAEKEWVTSWTGAGGLDYEALLQGQETTPSGRRCGGVLAVLFQCFIDINDKKDYAGASPRLKEFTILFNSKASADSFTASNEALTRSESVVLPEQRLRLDELHLERLYLSLPILIRVIDWTVLTKLVILNCHFTSMLWSTLTLKFGAKASPRDTWHTVRSKESRPTPTKQPTNCRLALKSIQTDFVTDDFLSMIKQALPINSLECLYLQGNSRLCSMGDVANIESILKALKRHRTSLKKLLIDGLGMKSSHERAPNHSDRRRRHWVLERDDLRWLLTGNVPHLTELCVCIHHSDWHYLLRNLPYLHHLNALYVPYVKGLSGFSQPQPALDVVYDGLADEDLEKLDRKTKELARQVVDVVAVSRHLRLRWLGLLHKCYAISQMRIDGTVANRRYSEYSDYESESESVDDEPEWPDPDDTPSIAGDQDDNDEANEDGEDEIAIEDDEDENDEEDDEEDDADGSDNTSNTDTASVEDEHEYDNDNEHGNNKGDSNSATHTSRGVRVRWRLREIIWFDDRVSIFKARHRAIV